MVEGSVRGVDPRDQTRANRPDDALDLDEFPAAVVCAHCGRGDCTGQCDGRDDASQVFAIVPWERPGSRWLRRLWTTARLATLNHESFFAALPGGDLAPALRFAATAELATVTLHAGLLVALGAVVFPDLPRAVVASQTLQLWLLRGALLGLPLAAGAMVALRLAHGFGLDLAARLQGGRSRHGLRFGCYSCGWDLMTLPLGVVLTGLTVGPRAALRVLGLGITVPRRAGTAYLRGVHQLDGQGLRRAARIGAWLPAVLLLAALLLVAAVAAFLVGLAGGD